jgi:hypothetical protein
MKEELIKLYKEYRDFIADNWSRDDIGATRVEEVRGNFSYFMDWLDKGYGADFKS